MAVTACARDLAAAMGFKGPILLLTDNELLRDHVQSGLLSGFVTTPWRAMHIKVVRNSRLV